MVTDIYRVASLAWALNEPTPLHKGGSHIGVIQPGTLEAATDSQEEKEKLT